jgi:hypothetical protein
VTAALVRGSFFLEKFRKPAKHPILPPGGLIDEGLTVIDKKGEVDFILIKRPISHAKPFAIDGKFQFFHCMIIRLKQFIFRNIFLIPLIFLFFVETSLNPRSFLEQR